MDPPPSRTSTRIRNKKESVAAKVTPATRPRPRRKPPPSGSVVNPYKKSRQSAAPKRPPSNTAPKRIPDYPTLPAPWQSPTPKFCQIIDLPRINASDIAVPQQDFEAIFPPPPKVTEEFSFRGILQSISDNPIRFGPGENSVDMGSLSFNTNAYEKKVFEAERDFFLALANHSVYYPLAEKIEDPDPNNPEMSFRLYILCRAPNAPRKRSLLNHALLIFSLVHVKKEFRGMDLARNPQRFADAQYEPGCIHVHFKCLFSIFRKHGIIYQYGSDFGGTGTLVYLASDLRWSFVVAVAVFWY